jgi:Stage II sporulation protein E (SpoIIE)
MPLGMFQDQHFPVHRLKLADADSLLLYTDGLTEARNGAGAEYGLQRIRALAACHAGTNPAGLISECLGDLLSFGEGSKQTDDLTPLPIRRAEKNGAPGLRLATSENFPLYASVKPDIVRGKSAGVRVDRGAWREFVEAMVCTTTEATECLSRLDPESINEASQRLGGAGLLRPAVFSDVYLVNDLIPLSRQRRPFSAARVLAPGGKVACGASSSCVRARSEAVTLRDRSAREFGWLQSSLVFEFAMGWRKKCAPLLLTARVWWKRLAVSAAWRC